mmetsp:Transcript_6837/g.28347  ORF Transcript_6837/g.28347 Transcript_6837/m.28347 type:complete len:277 (+) Transcript_6837:814-1644(+)
MARRCSRAAPTVGCTRGSSPTGRSPSWVGPRRTARGSRRWRGDARCCSGSSGRAGKPPGRTRLRFRRRTRTNPRRRSGPSTAGRRIRRRDGRGRCRTSSSWARTSATCGRLSTSAGSTVRRRSAYRCTVTPRTSTRSRRIPPIPTCSRRAPRRTGCSCGTRTSERWRGPRPSGSSGGASASARRRCRKARRTSPTGGPSTAKTAPRATPVTTSPSAASSARSPSSTASRCNRWSSSRTSDRLWTTSSTAAAPALCSPRLRTIYASTCTTSTGGTRT